MANPAPEGGSGYPRPTLRRRRWWTLNGPWDFFIDFEGSRQVPSEVPFDRTILVPFAPETTRSGVHDTRMFRACWYRRRFVPPRFADGERLLVHFGAVDYLATVWLNGVPLIVHEGGYTPFSVDITDYVKDAESCELFVRAFDDPTDLAKPRGKQDWQPEPHSIWYPRTTGIWQTVWCEVVPRTYIQTLVWTTNLERWEVGIQAKIEGTSKSALYLGVKLDARGTTMASDRYSVNSGEVYRRIALSDPGIDDFRNELLWSPSSPTLLDAQLTLMDEQGTTIDEVRSYTALRSFAVQGDRCLLNGRPYQLRMVLDQGYWPETGLTPPDDAALRYDVEMTKRMGFNGARKHQKIEDPRYLYWADKLGLLVWAEMPSVYRFTRESVDRLTRQWLDVMQRDASHPCIIAWVPFNESWGVPNLPENVTERNYVRALYYLTKTIDPTRPVIGNDGWESVLTDIIGIHDYDHDPQRIKKRYAGHEVLPALLRRERPGGRAIVLESNAEHPLVLSEFGGITLSDREGDWGYSRVRTSEALEAAYRALLEAVCSRATLSGFCYTQLTDTYQEANGLLYADRTPKFPIERICEATSGPIRGATELNAQTERFGAPE